MSSDCSSIGTCPGQTILSLAEMSERMNIIGLFDEKTRQITTGDGRVVEPISYGREASPDKSSVGDGRGALLRLYAVSRWGA